MSWGAVIVGGASLIGGGLAAKSQKDAAKDATAATSDAAVKAAEIELKGTKLGIEETKRQFDEIRQLLSPYVNAGNSSIMAQMDLIGLNGPDAQKRAVDMIKGGAKFTALSEAGNEAILSNASATGGLRGGNVNRALADFDQSLLADLIQEQYGNLGGITSIGQNAAAGVGNAGMNASGQIVDLIRQGSLSSANSIRTSGDAASQAILAGGAANAKLYGDIANTIGQFAGEKF